MRSRLERAEARGDRRRIAELEADLALPRFPRELAYLWRAYLRLRQRTAPGIDGPAPIGWQDIDAFVRLSGLALTPWEIEVLEALDNICLDPEPRPTMPEGGARAVAAASDVAGVKAIMGSVGRRRKVNRGG